MISSIKIPAIIGKIFTVILLTNFVLPYNVNAQRRIINIITNTTDEVRKLNKAKLGAGAISGSRRLAQNISMAATASEIFANTSVSNKRLRLYVGEEALQTISFIPDCGSIQWDCTKFPNNIQLGNVLNTLQIDGHTFDGVDYIIEDDLFSSERISAILNEQGANVYIPSISNESYNTYKIKPRYGTTQLYVEVSPTSLIEKTSDALKEFDQLKKIRFDIENISVVSLFDELADGEVIKNISSSLENLKTKNLEDTEDLFDELNDLSDKIIFLISHVEGNNFVVRDARSNIKFSVQIVDIMAFAEKKNITIIPMGCSTANTPIATGYSKEVFSQSIVSELKTALSSQNYSEFIASFGESGNPYYWSYNTYGNIKVIELERSSLRNRNKAINITIVSSTLLEAYSAEHSFLNRTYNFVSNTVSIVWFIIKWSFYIAVGFVIFIVIQMVVDKFK